MPIPAIIPAAGALLGKLGLGAKLASALGAAKGLVGLGAAKGAAASGLGSLGSRMAGSKLLSGIGGRIASNMGPVGFGSREAMTNTAMMFGPDLAFGAMAGAMTPGDLGDKVIAGGMTGLGGALGGVGARGLVGSSNAAVNMGLELGGGLVGDMAGQGVSDNLLRIKGGGSTPYEKMAADQQRELEQRILAQYLSGKGGYPMNNGMV